MVKDDNLLKFNNNNKNQQQQQQQQQNLNDYAVAAAAAAELFNLQATAAMFPSLLPTSTTANNNNNSNNNSDINSLLQMNNLFNLNPNSIYYQSLLPPPQPTPQQQQQQTSNQKQQQNQQNNNKNLIKSKQQQQQQNKPSKSNSNDKVAQTSHQTSQLNSNNNDFLQLYQNEMLASLFNASAATSNNNNNNNNQNNLLNDLFLNPSLFAVAANCFQPAVQQQPLPPPPPPKPKTPQSNSSSYSIKDLIDKDTKSSKPPPAPTSTAALTQPQQNSLYSNMDLNLWNTIIQSAALLGASTPNDLLSYFQPQQSFNSVLPKPPQITNFVNNNNSSSDSNNFLNLYSTFATLAANNPQPTTSKQQQAVESINHANKKQEQQNNNSCEFDENKIRYPLKLKWKRETIVKEIHKNGIKGDVIYYSPCGKKLRTFQEIERYLVKQNIKNLTRDNFTFSSKFLIGTFLMPKKQLFNDLSDSNESEEVVKKELKFFILNEEQIVVKIRELNPLFKFKQQQPAATVTNSNGPISLTPNIILKQQEQQQFDQKLSILEYQQKCREIHDKLKLKQNEDKAERKRLLIEKKQEEKQQQNERKLKEKWFEAILNREYKKQIDDMQEKYLIEMPNYKKINGTTNIKEKEEDTETIVQTNEIISNYLMIIEFINNFKVQLTIDTEEKEQTHCCTMTYKQFYLGITNRNKKFSTQIINLVRLLLKLLINDYKDSLIIQNGAINNDNIKNNNNNTSNAVAAAGGCCNNNNGNNNSNNGLMSRNYIRTKSGFKINDLKLSNNNYSEVLRLYLVEKKRQQEHLFSFNNFKNIEFSDLSYLNEACVELEKKSFEILGYDLKCKLLAYFCNELLQSKYCLDELDEVIDDLNKYKHEKWQVECKLRDLKGKKYLDMVKQQQQQQNGNDVDNIEDTSKQNDKKLTNLNKRQIQLKELVDDSFNKLRGGVHLGQDRYMRNYWLLNKSGGVYVESSAETPIKTIKDECVEFKKEEPVKVEVEDSVSKSEENAVSKVENEIKTERQTSVAGEIPLDLSCKKVIKEEEVPIEDAPVAVVEEDNVNIEIKDLNDLLIVQPKSENGAIDNQTIDTKIQQLQLNLNSKLLSKLTYKNMETLILNYLQYSNEQEIDKSVYMNGSWWVIDEKKLIQQLENCLAKRGIRERILAKNLLTYKEQLSDENMYDKMKKFLESDENDVLAETVSIDDTGKKLTKSTSSTSTTVTGSFKNRLIVSFDDYEDIMDLNERKFKQSERDVLDMVYSLEQRIFNANLQSKFTSKNDTECGILPKCNRDNGLNTLELARKRLAELELNIERRYLKAPFIRKKNKIIIRSTTESEEASSSESDDNEGVVISNNETENNNQQAADKSLGAVSNATIQLTRWRKAVKEATSASQLSICIEQLDSCIAWDKSIMKVICQICNYDDNEDKLLLCDNCDSGYHTYCFKPVLKRIPDGNWYCFVCISKSKSEKQCFVCGQVSAQTIDSNNGFVKCDKCVKLFHLSCLPQARAFKNAKWLCLTCAAVSYNFNKN